MPKHALIIYSGGLDTTVCIPLMREQGFDQISTVTVDVGQPASDIEQATARAKDLGCSHHVADVKALFASDYCIPALKANADYFGYPVSTAIARPLIAKEAALLGKSLGVDAFVHGCTGKGNDQFRIEFGLRVFAPDVPVLAPIREMNLTRSWEIEYAEKHGLPIGQSKEKIWSIDENLWGRSIEGGRLEEPDYEPPEEIFQWTKPLEDAPNEPEIVEIEFEAGVPVDLRPSAIGARPSPFDIISSANALAGNHGVGRIDIMEDRMIGLKVRENYECPGAVLLIAAHSALEPLVMTHAEHAFIDSVQHRVTGVVRLRLFKGSVHVVGRTSPWALYSEAAASFDDKVELEQSLMSGMVQTHGMESLLYARLSRNLTDRTNA